MGAPEAATVTKKPVMPLINVWPCTNAINVLLLKPGSDPDIVGAANHWAFELGIRHLRLTTYLFVSLAVWWYSYPALLEQAVRWEVNWVAAVVMRNMLIIHLFYGGWHWFLYDRKDSLKNMKGYKFNPANIKADGTLDTEKGYNPSTC